MRTTEEIKIKKLMINDFEALTDLWNRAGLPFRQKGRDSKGNLELQILRNPQFFLGAFHSKKLIGSAILSCDLRKGWINRLAVDPNFKRTEVAKQLISKSENVLGECGVSIFCALIEEDNLASRELFKDCHYVEHHDIVYYSKRTSSDV